MDVTIQPAGRLEARLSVPGDKSISHRALMLAAVAEGVSRIAGLATGADVASTRRVLRQLGVRIDDDGETARLHGAGLDGLRAADGRLDCGNSGTTMRLLAGMLASRPFTSTLTGDRSLRRRPMRRIAEPLVAMGARVELSRQGTAPIRITGPRGRLRAISHRPEVASAQVKSCVLLAGLYADGPTTVEEPLASRDHTERMLRAMGAGLSVEELAAGRRVRVAPRPKLTPLDGRVPGDVSSAAYWLAAASLLPGSEVVVEGVGLNPTRAAVVDLLRDWGVHVGVEPRGEWAGEPLGDLTVRGADGPLGGGRVPAERVPALIDELPLLAALGPFSRDGVEISGAGELRVKESDRIASMAAALRALGAQVDEFPDGLAVSGGTGLRGGVVSAAGDHRVALAVASVAVAADGPVTIEGAEAMDVSFPGFDEALGRAARS